MLALPQGRWYLTGALASRDATGLITLIERKSAVISTSEGKLVRSGQIEAPLESVPGVQHALVHEAYVPPHPGPATTPTLALCHICVCACLLGQGRGYM